MLWPPLEQTLSLTALLSPPLGEVGRGSGRVGVVGSATRPPRPLTDPLRVGGEADIVRTPVVLNPSLLGNQKRQSLPKGWLDAVYRGKAH